MFGTTHLGWVGLNGYFFSFEQSPFAVSFFFFQVMFCGTATTIFSGAVAERMPFSAYLIVASLLSMLIYPVFGHWAWNGLETGTLTGWLGRRGFVDFAGSTVFTAWAAGWRLPRSWSSAREPAVFPETVHPGKLRPSTSRSPSLV